MKKLLLIGALAFAGLLTPAAAERVVPEDPGQIQYSYAPLIKEVAPAVVNIYTKRIIRRQQNSLFDDPFFQRFFGDRFSFGSPGEREQNALGSGVIVRGDGVVVTNRHVIEGADEIIVALADRREFEAELILADERSDLAVLRIDTEGEKLPSLPFQDSAEVEGGDIVLAIGNPFGVGQTVTSGIISALARTDVGITDYAFSLGFSLIGQLIFSILLLYLNPQNMVQLLRTITLHTTTGKTFKMLLFCAIIEL